ncbi:MAG: DUF1127 domain-containing protein [Cereibacter changlensis]|uniref:YjiS-like domain-containing protein n=2 Tax=Cereibacter changlensis TaxID=402884 RepID=A0A2T4JX66_9RHOB|nr:DUF1127 domain-containing protein [Cereibacter changlensis]PTE22519.1 hypothetical protein C5F48_06645 [Cereibacter changlensis JA139]PZX55230.1 uncharacterized protein YjiS (DUF1127 family) [Cereibacter changlensis]
MFASLHTAQLTLGRVQKGGTLARLLKTARLALVARRQRLQLARLDAAALADIGLTPAQARAEADRPLWDVPSTWLR